MPTYEPTATDDAPLLGMALGRREFLALAGIGVVSAGVLAATGARAGAAEISADPFTLGVASGDAQQDRVVIWTRLAPEPLTPETGFGMGATTEVPVRWRLAATEADLDAPATALASGEVTGVAAQGFSVHVDVAGLEPGQRYVYRFEVDGAGGQVLRSPVGHTATARAADDPTPVRFAVVNCQNLAREDGGVNHFHGHKHLMARDDIDFVLFIGDYIYEFGRAAHVPPRTIETLDDYRTRYAQYKRDPGLLEVHRRFPSYVIPDDHEWWNDIKGGNVSADADVARFNAALEAIWEHHPLRGGGPVPLSGAKNQLTLYRQIRWGSVLDLFMADGRQYRAPSLFGSTQANAIYAWLNGTTATWSTLANGTPMWFSGPTTGWNAYTGVRNNVTAIMSQRKAATPGTFNAVTLGGDIHCGAVTHVRRAMDHESEIVATEFINVPLASEPSGGINPGPEVRKGYNFLNGYTVCTAGVEAWTTQYVVGNQGTDPDGTVAPGDVWKIDAGASAGTVHLVEADPDPVVPEVATPLLLGVTAAATVGAIAYAGHRCGPSAGDVSHAGS